MGEEDDHEKTKECIASKAEINRFIASMKKMS